MAATLVSAPTPTLSLPPKPKPGHSQRRDPSGVLTRLLTSNAQWAADVARVEPTFFEQATKGQAPKVRVRPRLRAAQPN